jgi:hypothetical protein
MPSPGGPRLRGLESRRRPERPRGASVDPRGSGLGPSGPAVGSSWTPARLAPPRRWAPPPGLVARWLQALRLMSLAVTPRPRAGAQGQCSLRMQMAWSRRCLPSFLGDRPWRSEALTRPVCPKGAARTARFDRSPPGGAASRGQALARPPAGLRAAVRGSAG